jgi:hypothetical protein
MVEIMELKSWRRGHFQWHVLGFDFYEIYQLVQKSLVEDKWTDRQQDNIISFVSFFKESSLKKRTKCKRATRRKYTRLRS